MKECRASIILALHERVLRDASRLCQEDERVTLAEAVYAYSDELNTQLSEEEVLQVFKHLNLDSLLVKDEPKDQTYMREAVWDILKEREQQDKKWGEQNHDPFTYLTILLEEVGEFAKAALHVRFGGPESGNLRTECVQMAAVALAILECLDRGKWTFPPSGAANVVPFDDTLYEKGQGCDMRLGKFAA